MISLGRYMFRADRLWAYLKYVIALANLITMIYVTGWPWWVWIVWWACVAAIGTLLNYQPEETYDIDAPLRYNS